MKTIAKKTIIIFLIINLILSNLNVGIFGLLAADVDAIFSYVDINFVDPTTEEEITKVDIGQNTKMNISFGVAGDVVTEKTSIRINLDNSNFYFSSFTPNGDTNNATYGVTSVDSNGNKKTLTAVLHINADGTRYITIDDLSQGDTVNMRLEGYFKDDTAPNEKLTVTVNNEEKASLSASNVTNRITVSNAKTASKDKITYHSGNKEELAKNFPISYGISAKVSIPENWKKTEQIENLTIEDTLTFPSSMYILNSDNVNLADYIGLGENSVLSISDFTPVLSDDGTKITGIKLNKKLTYNDIESYLTNGEKIDLKYNENLIIEGEGTISNTLKTSYKTTNFADSTSPVTKNTTIDEINGAKFENTSKKLADGGLTSSTMSGGPGWYNGFLIEGDEVTYQISTKNTGDEAGNVKLTDIIPDGTELIEAKSDNTTNISLDETVNIDGNDKKAVIWNFENVPSGETVTATIKLKITNNADFTLINNLYKDEDYTKIETTGPELPVNKKRPDLEITKEAKSSSGEFSNPGDTVTYTIVVTNKGQESITTSVTDTLPDSLEEITTDVDGAVIENGTITWNDVTLDVGESKTYTITGKVKEGTTGKVTNTAIVDKDGEYEKTATATTEVFDEITVLNNTNISKIASKTTVDTGDEINYKVQLKNSGKKYNIADITGGKIVTTDTIPDGISYSGGAYYLIPNDDTHHTEGISYDETTRTITWELDNSIYNEFEANAEVNLYIPCSVIQEASEDKSIVISNKAISTTINKESNEANVTILQSTGLEIEKYVDKVYNTDNTLIYENKTQSNKDNVNIDFEENYPVQYKVKISNSSKDDITLNSTNGKFTDTIEQLQTITTDRTILISVYDPEGNKVKDDFTTYAYDGKSFSIDLTGTTIKARSYIVLEYKLKGYSDGVSKAKNTISNGTIESSAQDLVNKPAMSKSVAIVDKKSDWSDIGGTWDSSNLLYNLDFKNEMKCSATALENKYLVYKIHCEPGDNVLDTYTVTDTISDNLNFVTGITTRGELRSSGPVIGIYLDNVYTGYKYYGMINYNGNTQVTIDGKNLTVNFTLVDNTKSVKFDVYYLVEVDQTKLSNMISKMDAGIDVDAIDLINSANVKSNNTDSNGQPLVDLTDTTKVTVNDGILYPGIEKDYVGSFAPGETKVDSEGNVQITTGSANAGSSLVWQVTVNNADKDAAKKMRNYTVNDILPEIYKFNANYLNDSYTGAKYYPSIVIYKKDGTVKKSWSGKDFILPSGYENSNELTWNFNGEDYYLDPGEKMVIKFATAVKDVGSYGAFLNTAKLTTSSKFDKENIEQGVKTSNKTIENTAFANIYSHMTTSYKEIEYDPSLYNADYKQPEKDTGISKKDNDGNLKNYVQGHQGEIVKYTLNVKNESLVNMKNLAIIDRLPYVGDIGVIADYPRDSSFDVKWDSFIKAEIYDSNGSFSRAIDNDKVKITFSDEKNSTFEYGCKDWYGQNDVAIWTNSANDQTVNVRFMIDYNKEDNKTFLQPGETIKLTFYGRVPKYVEKTGESNIAWNNFAYGYKAYNAKTDKELSDLSIAEPAKVGVWVEKEEIVNPGIIKINKTYKANTGSTTAYFVLYKYNDDYDAFDPNSIEYEKYSDVISIDLDANTTKSYTFENLPSGTKYKIYETDKYGNILEANNNDWYTIEGQGVEITLESGETKEVNVIDTALEEYKGLVEITKKVVKYTGEEVVGGTYLFVIKDDAGNYVYEKDGEILKASSFSSDVLIHIYGGMTRTIDKLDIGKYKVYEVDENGNNINYDNEIGYSVSFSPSNEFEITRSNGNQRLTATNQLKREPVSVEITGNKKLTNKTLVADQFNFELIQTDKDKNEITDNNENQIKLYAKNNTNGDFKFNLNYDSEGEYYYTLKEVTGEDAKYKYDETIYFIKVTVTEENKVFVAKTEILEGGSDIVFNNEFIVEKTSISVEKIWNDNNDQDGKRPTQIKLQLKANNESKGEPIILTAGDDGIWQADELKYTWTDLPKYENEKEINYTVEELDVENGYNVTYNTETTGKVLITNTHAPEKTEYSIEKIWSDNNNQDGKRPTSIQVQLKAGDNNIGDPITLTAGENGIWDADELKYTWTDLPKYENGVEIKYTAIEAIVPSGYNVTYNTETTGKTIITNSYIPEQTEYSIEKVWVDNDNQDGKRPTTIKVQLKANGVIAKTETLTAGENGIWEESELKYTWNNLPKFADGVEIVYSVEEIEMNDDYSVNYNNSTAGKTIITNTHQVETTSYSIEKEWADNNNQDGIRPSSIKIQLKADDENYGDAVILNANEGNLWDALNSKYTWSNLPKYKNGKEIKYSVEEINVTDGYEATYVENTGKNSTKVINTHVPSVTKRLVEKIWNDGNNQDGKRPESIQVQLKADGIASGNEVSLNESNNWKYTWENLPEKQNGTVINYTVEEVSTIDGYNVSYNSITKDGVITTEITNTYTPEITSRAVEKIWNDENNRDAKRPTSIQVQLKANGENCGDSITLNDDNEWKYTWNDLAKNKDGKEIVYTIDEITQIQGYETTYSENTKNNIKTFVITNSYSPETTARAVEKVWNDNNNQDGLRPDSIQVKLKANGTIVENVALNESNNWKHTWNGLPKNENGNEINYEIEEISTVSGYTTTYDNQNNNGIVTSVITNTHTPEKVTRAVEKMWSDNSNQDGKRSKEIQVQLKANGENCGDSVTLNDDNRWSYTWNDLKKFENGKEIEYTIDEISNIDGYTTTYNSINKDGVNTIQITNKHTPERTKLAVEKEWDDNNNQDNKRVREIQVQLKVNGNNYGTPITLSSGNDWKYVWSDLAKYNNGVEQIYTVEEVTVIDGYNATYETSEKDGVKTFTIVNTHKPEETSYSVEKVWNDNNNQDKKRPESIEVQLKANGNNKGEKVILNTANEWKNTWNNLPKYENGTEVKYTVEEVSIPEGYTLSYNTETAGKTIITNSYTPEETSYRVEKVWNDNNNQDGKRPENIKVQLKVNGNNEGEAVTLDKSNNWNYTWSNLPKYNNGVKLVYSVEEVSVPEGYTVAYDTNALGKTTITNTHEIEKTERAVEKVWDDNNNQDGKQPESIQVQLKAGDNNVGDGITLNASNNWKYTWKNLDKYSNGEEIKYTIKEISKINGYDTKYESTVKDEVTTYVITNTHVPEVVSKSVEKVWNDNNNQDGKRPENIQVQLKANGNNKGDTITLNADNEWKYTWSSLEKYSDGKEVTYTIEELNVPEGYTVSYNTETEGKTIITNTHEVEKTSYRVEKIWNDNNNQDGKRSESIQVQLKANGNNEGAVITLNVDNELKYTWNDLPKYENGKEIVYSVEEVVPEGYTASYNTETEGKTIITNTHTPEETTYSVEKVWNDNENQDGKRPEDIKIQLKANGNNKGEAITLNEDNNWKYTWSNLPKYENGKEITYTVEEQVPEGYTVSYDTTTTGKTIITNTHTIEETTYSVEKVWDDNENQDGKRPTSIQVQLKAGENNVGNVVELNANNNWKYTWNNLPVYKNGEKIVYTADEVSVPSEYTKKVTEEANKTTITNTYTPGKTSVSVEKIWDDNDNQDGKRPDSIQLQLKANGVNKGEVITLSSGEDKIWQANEVKYTWIDLPEYENGEKIKYTVEEVNMSSDYTVGYNTDTERTTIITNTHTTEETTYSVEKVWDDSNNQDGKRPTNVQVQLKSNGNNEGVTITLNSENNWKYTWENLPKYNNGKEITYTVEEIVPERYTASYNTETEGKTIITNTHEVEKTSYSVEKVWNDNENQDGKRPTSIQVQLKANGNNKGEAITLNEENNWKNTWTNLPKYENGKEITYTVEEGVPEGYTASYDTETSGKTTITNTHEIEQTTYSVEKVWNDNENQDGKRPTSIQVQLKANGNNKGEAITLNEENNWKNTWTNLPKYENGKEITYTVEEIVPEGYTVSYNTETTGKTVITNTHETEKTTYSVEKVWNDNDNQDGKRPTSIQVQLKANGNNKGEAITLNEGNNWKNTWNDLPKYENGKEITYTVEEVVPEGYTALYDTETSGKTTITNSYTPGKTSISVEKIWNDNNNQDGKRPESIQVQLKANGNNEGETITLNAENNWKYTWNNLSEYENGIKVTYTVEETEVPTEYTVTYNNENSGKVIITNTHEVEKTTYNVEKVWNDSNNQDGKRPGSIQVQLKANGNNIGNEITLNAENNWKNTWNDLPKYEDGKLIIYTVEESSNIIGYTVSYNTEDSGKTIITNTHEVEKVEYSVEKKWNDNNNQDGKRPGSIQVQLKTGTANIDEAKTLNSANDWKYTWTNLPKYENGKEIKYTVEEVVPEGYTASYNTETEGKTIITNTHTPEETTYNVEKVWNDNNNQDGKRPTSIQVQLKVNGNNKGEAITLNEDNNWKNTWSNLPKFENGGEIKYTVEEVNVPKDYTESYNTNTEGKTIITNTHQIEETTYSVEKVWNDNNNQDGKRPTSIQVQLKANGSNKGEVITLSSNNNWKNTWTNLPKYENGKEIKYTVEEVVPEGYTASYNTETEGKTIITNTYETEKTTYSVEKVWNDNNDQDGKRPSDVQVQLKANGHNFGDLAKLNAENNWKNTWTDLPKYENGKEITYSVEEVVPEGYIASYNTETTGKTVITNTHEIEKISYSVEKVWNDNNNQDGKRLDSVKVQLKANGNNIGEVIILNVNNNWKNTWTNLPKYEDGKEITYSVEEVSVPNDYEVSYNTNSEGKTVITNTHKPEKISYRVEKKWDDMNNENKIRPNEIEVQLKANGINKGSTIKLNAENTWKNTWNDLPKYENGVEIKYSVEEVGTINGYTVTYDTNNENKTIITNTHKIVVNIEGTKTWVDHNNVENSRPTYITVNLLKNGVKEASKNVTAENNWKYSFDNLPKYDEQNNVINYTITEDEVDGYTTEINGYNITNTHVATIDISGTKTWVDYDNVDNTRPDKIVVNLLQDGKVIRTKEVSKNDNWSYSFKNLPKYDNNNNEIKYSISEEKVDKYTTEVVGYNIINTYKATTKIDVTKTWIDHNNADKTRPDKITIILLKDGIKIKEQEVSELDGWKYTFDNLEKYNDKNEKIHYTIEEETVNGYTSIIDGYNITNKYSGKVKISISGKKIWKDYNNKDNTRPNEIEVNLVKEGKVISTKKVTSANGWEYTFNDLDKYDEQGNEITYEITENKVDGYETEINGYDIINTYKAVTSINGRKIWMDDNNKDNTRPDSITVNLLRNGVIIKSKVVSEEDNWEYSFDNLEKYDEDNNEIKYSISENKVIGYQTNIIDNNIVNTYNPEIPEEPTNDDKNEEKDDDKKEEIQHHGTVKTSDNIMISFLTLITSIGVASILEKLKKSRKNK